MRARYLFALLLLLATACSKQDDGPAALDSPVDKTDVNPAVVEKNLATDAPKTDAPKTDAPKTDAPKTDAPKTDAPKTDAPKTDAPKTDAPKTDAPKTDAPKTDAPKTEEKTDVDPDSVVSRLDEAKSEFKLLNDEMSAGMRAYSAKMRTARSAEARDKASKSNPMIELGPKFVAFAKKYEGTDPAYSAIVTTASNGLADAKTEAMTMLTELVEADPNHDKIQSVMTTMARGMPSSEAYQLLTNISDNTTSPKIQGNAIFSRISMLDRIKSFKSFLADADEERIKAFDPEVIAFVNTERDPGEVLDLEKMLEKFIEDHKDSEDLKALLKKAVTELFAMQHLSVGKEAPEISGLDLDGIEFNLSDYRGKVVFLDFWGDW